nr:hypothetical protein CFP56_68103 [Quercus suber]
MFDDVSQDLKATWTLLDQTQSMISKAHAGKLFVASKLFWPIRTIAGSLLRPRSSNTCGSSRSATQNMRCSQCKDSFVLSWQARESSAS